MTYSKKHFHDLFQLPAALLVSPQKVALGGLHRPGLPREAHNLGPALH
jgi:hypothetical protein